MAPTQVAPHVGAWIEIPLMCEFCTRVIVAPHVGAWIEITSRLCLLPSLDIVAPHVGAWIEI